MAWSAYGQVKPSLAVDFKNGFDGVGSDGRAVPARIEGRPELAPGKFGKALKSGPGLGYIHYPSDGILSSEEGTVEMWVCPVDWQEGAKEEDKHFHIFFECMGNGRLMLYRYLEGGTKMFCLESNADGAATSAGECMTPSWSSGKWHHLAGVWSSVETCFYVDGKLAARSAGPAVTPRELGKEFRIGDYTTEPKRSASSLIERVRIYNKALPKETIQSHFAGD